MATPRSSSASALIGGRFRREASRGADGRGTWWQGVETRTGSAVQILVVEPAAAEAVTDAALRAKVLSHPVLPPIVEVIAPTKIDRRGYVVTRAATGQPLSQRLSSGPLAPKEAGRVVAEISSALAQAEGAGIHHGNLRPENVLIDPAGKVQVTGVGFGGPLAEVSEADAAGADLRSLSGLLYAALTGYWPGAAPRSRELPGAPTLNGRVVPPSQITTGVGTDLSQLAVDGLAAQPTGATSVSDMAARLATWRDTGTEPEKAGWYASRGTNTIPADDEVTDPEPVVEPEPEDAYAEDESSEDADGHSRPQAGAVTVLAAAGGGLLGRLLRRRHDVEADLVNPADESDSSATTAAPAAAESPEMDENPDTASFPVVTRTQEPTPVVGLDEAEDALEDEPDSTMRRGSSAFAAAPQRARAAVASAAASPVAVRATQQVRAASGSAQRMMDRLHPEIPHLTDEEKRSRTKAVVGILSAGLVLALILSLISIFTLFHRTEEIAQSLQPTNTATTKAPVKTSSTPVVLAVTAEDPLGDKEENDDRADMAIDKRLNTSWTSSRYASSEFGGLKNGVGLMLTFRATAPVKQVNLAQYGEGGTVEIRNAPKGTFEGSTVVGKADLQRGMTTIAVNGAPVTKNILVWFTSLPRTGGGFRAQVNEVTVK